MESSFEMSLRNIIVLKMREELSRCPTIYTDVYAYEAFLYHFW